MYSNKIAHAKKVEVEYLATFDFVRCLIFKLHFSYLMNRCLRGCLQLEGGVLLMY